MSDERVAQLRDHAYRNMDATLMQDAADTIESLQQRCEELEQEIAKRHQIERLKIRSIAFRDQHIAALEAGVDKALIQISGGLCYKTTSAKHQQLTDAHKTLEALTSSEGAGECPNQCRDGWIDAEERFCPIHSPTSAGEGREDG